MAPPREQPDADAAAVEGEAGRDDRRGGGGNKKLARQLLKPRRRAQIEVWLGETVGEHETQYCAAGNLFGHCSDFSTQPATDQPNGEGQSSMPVDDAQACPVCGRCSEGSEGPTAHPTGTDTSWPVEGSKPGRGRHMLRGIRAAMGQFRAREGGKGGGEDDGGEGPGRAVASTAMFLAEASEGDDSSVATAFSSSGPFGAEDGRAPPDGRRALEERMKRLMRAQKLLERSQAGRS